MPNRAKAPGRADSHVATGVASSAKTARTAGMSPWANAASPTSSTCDGARGVADDLEAGCLSRWQWPHPPDM